MIYCQFVDYQSGEKTKWFGPFEFLQERYGEIIDNLGKTVANKYNAVNRWTVCGEEPIYSDVVFSSTPG